MKRDGRRDTGAVKEGGEEGRRDTGAGKEGGEEGGREGGKEGYRSWEGWR